MRVLKVLTLLSLVLCFSCKKETQENTSKTHAPVKRSNEPENFDFSKPLLREVTASDNVESCEDFSDIVSLMKKYDIPLRYGYQLELSILKKHFIDYKNSGVSFEKYIEMNYKLDLAITLILTKASKNNLDLSLKILNELLLKLFTAPKRQVLLSKVEKIQKKHLTTIQSIVYKDDSEKNMKKILMAIAEYAAFHEFKLPEKLEDLKSILGEGFDKVLICPMTNKKYQYFKNEKSYYELESKKNIKILESKIGSSVLIGYLDMEVKFFKDFTKAE